jgi:SAM-dependent methyltransferase
VTRDVPRLAPRPPRGGVEAGIPGDYQLRALHHGWRLQRAWHRGRLDLVASVLPPAQGGLVLDAAAGSGILTWRFRDARIVSADMRPSACAVVRSHTPGAPAVAAVLDALPFVSGTFRQIYFLEALEHLTPEAGARALRELHRVATIGAHCLITTPNYRSGWPAIERVLDGLRLTPPMADEQHVSRYNRRSLSAIVTAAGWTVRRVGTFNLAAPIAGLISARAGAWFVEREAARLAGGGPLLFALCERRS